MLLRRQTVLLLRQTVLVDLVLLRLLPLLRLLLLLGLLLLLRLLPPELRAAHLPDLAEDLGCDEC